VTLASVLKQGFLQSSQVVSIRRQFGWVVLTEITSPLTPSEAGSYPSHCLIAASW